MTVTVVSCVYGPTFARFLPRWSEHVALLSPKPDAVIVAADWPHDVPGARVIASECPWRHPQAWYLNQAIAAADTEWVWIVDVDDCARPDGLAGLDQVDADVWQTGYLRSDGETYVPGPEALAAAGNMLVAGSAIRTKAFWDVGGFPDVAFQDWALWRKLQAAGARFAFSGRVNFDYMRHSHTRGATELTADRRAEHVQEMQLVA